MDGAYTETAARYYGGNIRQLHAKTGIRLIGSKTIHGLLPGHTLDWKLHLKADCFLTDIFQQLFIHCNHIVHIHKGQFHIHLCEFGLSVRTQILITEASCDLEIPVIA